MTNFKQKWKALTLPLRIGIYVIGGIIILAIILQIIASVWGDHYIGQRIKKTVVQSTNGMYRITYSDLDLGLYSGSITIHNLQIQADTSVFHPDTAYSVEPPSAVYKGRVNKLKISGLHILSALVGNKLDIGAILIQKPEIIAIKNPNPVTTSTSGQFPSLDSTIYAAISGQYKSFKLGHFKIKQGHFYSLQTGDTVAFLGHLNLSLNNIKIDSASVHSGRKLITNDISMNARHLMIKLPDSLNKIAIKRLVISSDSQSILLDSLQLIPRYPKFIFSRKNGVQIDRINLSIPRLVGRHVNFHAFAKTGRLHIGYVEIDGARLEDFHSKVPPKGPKEIKHLYNASLIHLGQKIKFDSIKIKNSYVSYAEYHPHAPDIGKVTFENLNATFHNLTNYPEAIKKGERVKVYAQANVMGKGLLQVHWTFPLDTNNAFHKVRGSLGSMPLTAFNPILKYVAFVKIDSGKLNSMEFEFTGNSERSSGTLSMNYQNLKVSVLKKKTAKQQGLLKNVISFIANAFIINKNNVPQDGKQTEKIYFKRNKYKSTWNFWWKSILSGIKDSIK